MLTLDNKQKIIAAIKANRSNFSGSDAKYATSLGINKGVFSRILKGETERAQLRQFMQGYDLIATPSVSVPAFEARPAGHTPIDPAALLGWTPFSYPFNLSQQPAASIPCGLTSEGLPIGLQLVGPMFGDALVLRACRAYESLRPIARPPMAWASAD